MVECSLVWHSHLLGGTVVNHICWWFLKPMELKPVYSMRTRSMSWLLMLWLFVSTGHHQPWYWIYGRLGNFLPQRSISSICILLLLRKQSVILCHRWFRPWLAWLSGTKPLPKQCQLIEIYRIIQYNIILYIYTMYHVPWRARGHFCSGLSVLTHWPLGDLNVILKM